MRLNKPLLSLLILTYAMIQTSALHSGDENGVAAEEVAAIVEYRGSGLVLQSTDEEFQRVVSGICALPEAQRRLAVCNILEVIAKSSIDVVDKGQKLKLIFSKMASGQLPVNERILSYVLPYLDSRESNEVFELAAKLILSHGKLVFVTPEGGERIIGVVRE